jgi:hypothetical protein
MGCVVLNMAFFQPLPESLHKKIIAEILTPQCAISDASLCHGAIQVQHTYQAWPCTAPIDNCQDRAKVLVEAR